MKAKEKFLKTYGKITKNLIQKTATTIENIYSGDTKYNTKLINTYKVLVASSKKFFEDDCLTKASAIAYTTIISLIPTLTVVLTFYSIFSGVKDKKEELFTKITTFMVEHNIKLNIDPILESISSLVENAGKIGGIGAVILVFSATAVLRTLDKSLNDIWHIKIHRTFFLKVIYFWTALSLGPVLIISGSALTNQLTSILSSPNYSSAEFTKDGKTWTVGTKADIQYSDKSEIKFSQLPVSSIDLENQQSYHFDLANKTFIDHEFRVEELEFNKTEFKDIQFINNYGWIIGKNGLLLSSNNNGKSWNLKKLGSFGFNDIHMIDSEKGFIAADNGYLLSTNDGWQEIAVYEWKDIAVNLKSINFLKDHGIITGERGLIITTQNKGKSWDYSYIPEAKLKKSYVNINSSYFISSDRIILTCDDGIVLISNDAGKTWDKKKYFDENYTAAYFINNKIGFLAGSKGILISTADGGQNWYKQTLSISNINSLTFNNNELWAFGDNGMILKSTDNGKTWEGKKGKNLLLYFTNFFAPFIYIWLLFFLIYTFFPNTKVPFKAAAIGASFTSAIWVIFILSFEIYVKAFAKGSLAIYGALAAIPLFLLMVYTSFVIVLYGAEVSYTLMHPHTYLKLRRSVGYKKDIYIYYGISILYHIYKKFETGKGYSNSKELLKITLNNDEELSYFIELFRKENYIAVETDEKILPANSSKNINISEVINLIHDVSLFVPGAVSSRDKLKKTMEDIFDKIRKSKDSIIGKITLADLIKRTG